MVDTDVAEPPPLIACIYVDDYHIIHIEEVTAGFSINDTLSQYKAKDQFMDDLLKLTNPQILATIHRYLGFLYEAENVALHNLNEYYPVSKHILRKHEMENFVALEMKLETLGITIENLKEFYGKFLVTTYFLKATIIEDHLNGSKEIELFSETPQLWSINLDGKVCIKLELPKIIHRGALKPLIEVAVDFDRLQATKNTFDDHSIYERKLIIYIPHTKENPRDRLVQEIWAGSSTEITLYLSANYASFSQEGSSCGTHSVAKCNELCISEMVQQQCIFWFSVMIVFFVVLSLDITQLSKQYFNHESISKVELHISDVTDVPPLIACINIAEDHIIDLTNFEQVDLSITDQMTKYNSKSDFINDLMNVSSTPLLFLTALRYLAFTNGEEKALLHRLKTYKPNVEYIMAYSDYENLPALEMKLSELEIDVSDLKRYCAKVIVNTYFTKAIFVENSRNGQIHSEMLSDYPILWSVNPINWESCLKLDVPQNMESAIPDPMVHLEVNFNNLHTSPYLLFHRNLKLFITDHKMNPIYHLMQNVKSGEAIEDVTEVHISHKTIAKHKCATQSVATCNELCMSQMIENRCQCKPLFLKIVNHGNASKYPTCNFLENYKGLCLTKYVDESLGEQTKQCLRNCVPPCEHIIYESTKRDEIIIEEGKTELYETLSLFNYRKYEHVPAFTWESFIGAFGGTMGIWFGASMLSVIHMFVILVNYCVRKVSSIVFPGDIVVNNNE